MSFRRRPLLLFLLLTGILLCNTGKAQRGIEDSMEISAPPPPDTIYSEASAEEYYEEYESNVSYEDSIRRAKANAFDTLHEATPPFSASGLPSHFMEQLKRDKTFDYVKHGIPKPVSKLKQPKQRIKIFQLSDVWIYLIVIAFLLLLAWYLHKNDLLFFKKKPIAAPIAATDGLPKDIFSIPYTEAIRDAVQSRNYRMAIRLHYLQLLKTLSEKGIIQYQADKTNFDYVLQIRPTPYHLEFSGLTRQYEYSWYGLFEVSPAQYEQVHQQFTNFHKKIGI